MNTKKILVTGGAGFIGSHLVDALLEQGHQVVIVDNLSTGLERNINPQAKFVQMDIQDKGLTSVFEENKPEVVFHLAAQINVRSSIDDPINDAQANILGGLNLLENCRKNGVSKFIFSSTGGALYGDADILPTPETYPAKPLSPYGIAKLTIENYLRFYNLVHGLNYTTLRYANVYGPRQNSLAEAGVVAIFITKILNNEQPRINGDGKQTRDYVFAEDVVSANLKALENQKTGTYNIATSVQNDVNQVFNLISQNFTDKETKEEHSEGIKGEQRTSCLDIGLAKKELDWEPKVSLEDGIKKTVEWFRENFKF